MVMTGGRWRGSPVRSGQGYQRPLNYLKDAPSSIGVDSWGVDFVLLDEKGELVDTPIAYRDSRTEGMQELWKYHDA